jgi:hypothetical protein
MPSLLLRRTARAAEVPCTAQPFGRRWPRAIPRGASPGRPRHWPSEAACPAARTSGCRPSPSAAAPVRSRPGRPRLVLSCLIHASCWANAPRWGGRLRCWLAAPLPLPQTWTCSAVQIVTRVSLSLYLGPRLVNAVSLLAPRLFSCQSRRIEGIGLPGGKPDEESQLFFPNGPSLKGVDS